MIKALRIFAKVWMLGFFCVVLIRAATHIFVAESLWNGITDVLYWFSPFNAWNWIAIVACVAPAIGAHVLAEKLDQQEHRTAPKP